MKKFAISEKKRYMKYLLEHKIKDISSIVTFCNTLFELYTIKQDLLFAIWRSQSGNIKGLIQLHINEHKRKMANLDDFLLALIPDVPFYPKRNDQDNNTKP